MLIGIKLQFNNYLRENKMTKSKEYWAEKVEQLPLVVKLLVITIMLPVLVIATIGMLYINTIQHNRFVKKRQK